MTENVTELPKCVGEVDSHAATGGELQRGDRKCQSGSHSKELHESKKGDVCSRTHRQGRFVKKTHKEMRKRGERGARKT